MSRDSVISTTADYGLDDQGGSSSSPDMDKIFSLLHVIQTGSGAHPALYPMGTGAALPGGKVIRA
jgi:hypothetical protein